MRRGRCTPGERGLCTRVLVLASFIESEQRVAANELRLHGLGYTFTDMVTNQQFTSDQDLLLAPYSFVWLKAE